MTFMEDKRNGFLINIFRITLSLRPSICDHVCGVTTLHRPVLSTDTYRVSTETALAHLFLCVGSPRPAKGYSLVIAIIII
jgi:hypothetical protein